MILKIFENFFLRNYAFYEKSPKNIFLSKNDGE